MNMLALALGLGLVGLLLIVVPGLLLGFRITRQVDDQSKEREAAEAEAKQATAANAVLETNIAALRLENDTLRTNTVALTAQLRAAEKVADDLTAAVQAEPSALPAALRAQLDELRSHVQVPRSAQTAPAGDQNGGETGAVHGGPAEPPA